MRRAIAIGVLVLALAPLAAAKDGAPTWDDVARGARLSDDAIAHLERDGLVVGAAPLKQVFQPYLSERLPLFITTDSVLNAWCVLFESSVMLLEQRRAARLPDALEILYRRIPEAAKGVELEQELVVRSARRLRCVVAVALALVGRPVADLDEEDAALVRTEVDRIERAEGRASPAWLGPYTAAFRAIDYGRFRPRGPYEATPELQRYFRTTAWLQAVPFRLERNEELVAALLVSEALPRASRTPEGKRIREARDTLRLPPGLLGRPDDEPAFDVRWRSGRPRQDEFDAWKRERLRHSREPLIVDQIATARLGPTARILPAARTPTALLFQSSVHPAPDAQADRVPSGLDLAAALGSDLARSLVEASEGKAVLSRIDGAEGILEHDGLASDFLKAVEALYLPVDPAAADVFRSDAWQRKSLNTGLAAWSGLRHAIVLQSKQSSALGCGYRTIPGIVEPNPEFYARLRDATRRAFNLFDGSGAFVLPSSRERLLDATELFLEQLDREPPPAPGDRRFWSGQRLRGLSSHVARILEKEARRRGALFDADAETPALRRAAIRTAIESLRDELRQGDDALTETHRRILGAFNTVSGGLVSPARQWGELERMLYELEILAVKQLAGRPATPRDRKFFERFGDRLGKLFLYSSNLYHMPRDDAPRISDVHHDPFRGVILHAAMARPRTIHLLYPHEEGPILCVGGVMSYREVRAQRVLNDQDWRALLDAGEAEVPAWFRPLVAATPEPDPAPAR